MLRGGDEMSEPDKPQGKDDPELLGYRSGIDERKVTPRVPIVLQFFLAFFASGATIVAAGLFGAIAGRGAWIGLLLVVLACGLLAVIANIMRDDHLKRGWVIGIVVGIGVAGMLAGTCFLMVK